MACVSRFKCVWTIINAATPSSLFRHKSNCVRDLFRPKGKTGRMCDGISRPAMGSCYVICVLLLGSTLMAAERSQAHRSHGLQGGILREPCRNLVLYFHDIIYNGLNADNATSAIVGAPQRANLTILAGNNHFGDLAVFDDPITLDNNLHSPPVGRAQGFYFYDMKNTFSSWLGFTFVLNSTDYKGTITFSGADPILVHSRDISVVGGTGDFLMARGIATIQTDAYEGDVYFRLRVNITLYECY